MTNTDKLTLATVLLVLALILSTIGRAHNFSYKETANELLVSPQLKEVIVNASSLLEEEAGVSSLKEKLRVELIPGCIKIYYLPTMGDDTLQPRLRETKPGKLKRMGTYLWEHKKGIMTTTISIVVAILMAVL